MRSPSIVECALRSRSPRSASRALASGSSWVSRLTTHAEVVGLRDAAIALDPFGVTVLFGRLGQLLSAAR